ncbi:uncharacterized protein LOC113497327 [Trichoplusia ni]|uniref:Uncharacterized protein LOC113497327 n=1 Tax=Trichoplusia ni TaxID=7111 RepID=A0A7E5VWD0_TRINI|nr:uncharacterized protein LOC113497327 [Trichoplusia ni]
MSQTNEAVDEEKLLNNGRLFNVIRKNKTPYEKQEKIIKHLERGADINAVDANDNGNTPLHIAVLKAETEIVSFLLSRGANVYLENSKGQTAADVARQHSKEIYNLLIHHTVNNSTNKKEDNVNDLKKKRVFNREPKEILKLQKKELNDDTVTAQAQYLKRIGSSGISGYFYETKLLTLILLRAEVDKDLEEFYLGTNIDGLGAFDDIVFQYKRRGQASKTIFLQAKHKNPINDKLKVSDMFKKNEDFCVQKYFDSYLEIKGKFDSEINDVIFKGTTLNDCEFILYTSATENFAKKREIEHCDEAFFIETCGNGKVFHFQYDDQDLEKILQSVVETRAVSLAKKLAKFIAKEKCDSIMADDVIKIYHVFVARDILIQDEQTKLWKFRKTFLSSNDKLLVSIKQTIINELKKNKHIETLSLKLPSNFGNVSFNLKEKKKHKLLHMLCTKFCHLFKTADKKDLISVIEINERSFNEGSILQQNDLEPHLIGGLVGNLLIFDDETKMLKFNLNKTSLPGHSLNLLELLQDKENDLEQYRFEFNILRFPKLCLINEKIDLEIIRDFLAKLKFFTNQAKEDQIESILRKEIQEVCNSRKQTQGIKCEAVFFKMHDKVLKWWQQPQNVPYYNKSTQCFKETIKNIQNNTLLTTLDFIYIKNLESLRASFKSSAIKALNVHTFIQSNIRINVLQSDEVSLTSIKLKQYFEENLSVTNMFLELNTHITDNDLEAVKTELKVINIYVLVLVYQHSKALAHKLKAVTDAFRSKIIIITNDIEEIKQTLRENVIIKRDDKLRFLDYSKKTRGSIIEQGELIFQGHKLPINSEVLKKLKPQIIRRIANRETVTIGESPEMVSCYITRSICRCITLGMRNPDFAEVHFINDCGPENTPLQAHQDIVIMSDCEKIFDDNCKKYEDRNVHWFSREANGRGNIWLKSRGNITTLQKYIDKETRTDYILQPETIKDVNDKVVIITAEPGMGKTTLLTHLAIQTKNKFPSMWITKINLVEHIHLLYKWEKEDIVITIKEVILFLYSAIDIKARIVTIGNTKYNCSFSENLRNRTFINNVNKVYLDGGSDGNNKDDLDDVGVHFFNYCYNNGQLALLFDGFDEICPEYTDVVLKMLITLKSSKLAHLWVTTRPYQNVLSQLENALGTFSFTLQPLYGFEQEHLLRQIWCAPLKLDGDDFLKASSYVYTFYRAITSSIGVGVGISFTSIPLHLHMIADIFQDYFQVIYFKQTSDSEAAKLSDAQSDFLNDISNICTLYEFFVDRKFYKIRFGNQKHSMDPKDMHYFSHIYNMDDYIQKEHQIFLDSHKKFGAYELFNNHDIPDLFSKEEIQEVSVFIDSIKSGKEKTGIVECSTITKEPKFVHLTYAEYFATEFICDKLKDGSSTCSMLKCLINYICLHVAGMRRFFNSKLIKVPQLLDFIIDGDHSSTVLGILLSQNSLPNTALHILIDEHYNTTATFLLKCTRKAINKNNVDDFIALLMKYSQRGCVLCSLVASNQVDLLNDIFEIVKRVDELKIQKLFFCKHNHLMLALSTIRNLYMTTVSILLNEIACYKDFIVEVFTVLGECDDFTASHVMSMKFVIKIISHHLMGLSLEQLTRIFSVENFRKEIPAHFAAQMNNYDYFETIYNLLGKDKFRDICMTEDNAGFTPIMFFRQNQYANNHFKNLIEIVFDVKDIQDVKEFIFQKTAPNIQRSNYFLAKGQITHFASSY